MDPFLDSDAPLKPTGAVAAIITVGRGGYLLQHRDPKPEIFFPDHWSFFGGEAEAGENHEQTVQRELQEEIGLRVTPEQLRFFTEFNFDIGFAGGPVIARAFYEVDIPEAALADLRLAEGQGMAVFTGRDALSTLRLAPYDSFAMWMHCYQHRFRY